MLHTRFKAESPVLRVGSCHGTQPKVTGLSALPRKANLDKPAACRAPTGQLRFQLHLPGEILSLAFRLSNLFLRRGDDVLHGEAEMFLKVLQWRGGSEAAHADAVARHAHVARPSECRGHLDGDAGLHPGWQDGIPV